MAKPAVSLTQTFALDRAGLPPGAAQHLGQQALALGLEHRPRAGGRSARAPGPGRGRAAAGRVNIDACAGSVQQAVEKTSERALPEAAREASAGDAPLGAP